MRMLKKSWLKRGAALRDSVRGFVVDAGVLPTWVTRALLSARASTLHLKLDVYVTLDEVVVQAPVPGLTAKQIDITFTEDILTLRAETPPLVRNVQYITHERPQGIWERTLRLEVPVDATQAEAIIENGVLTIVLPKIQAQGSNVIRVAPTQHAAGR